MIEEWLSMIFSENNLATEECDYHYKSSCKKRNKLKKKCLCGRIIQICQPNKSEIVSFKHKYWGNPFLYVSFPCSFFTLAEIFIEIGDTFMWFNQYQFSILISHQIYFHPSNPTKLAIPLNPNFSFLIIKKLGQLCCIYGQLSEFERVKIKSPSILGAISLPIWSLACHHRMFVHPPIPTHMHQNVRIDCNNNFVSIVKICECFSQNESSKLNQWIQWFYKNIWFKKSKIVNQNLHALKKLLLKIKKNLSYESKFHASA